MSWTNLVLGGNWDGEWPEYVEVCHEGEGDYTRYVPERTCRMGAPIDGEYRCSECGHLQKDTYRFDKGWHSPMYCAHCGALVIGDEDAD